MTRNSIAWDQVTVQDLGEIVAGGTPSRPTEAYWNGSIPWITPGELKDLPGKYVCETRENITTEGLSASAARLLPVGSLLVTTRATIGEVVIAAVPVATNQGFKSIIPNDYTDSLFAYYQLTTLKSEMSRVSSGTTFPEISKADFCRIRTARPKLAEQRQVAALLAMLDEVIANTKAIVAKLKEIRSGLLHDLLTRGLDKNGELREPTFHPRHFQDSMLGRIPACWDVISVEQAGEVRLGRQRSPAHETGQHIRPYLRVANVYDCFIDYSDVLAMNFNPNEQETYRLSAGDILLNEGQSLELVGRSAIYQGPPDTYCFQNTLVRFRCNDTTIPEYCQAVFKYWLDTGAFTLIAKQTTSVAHLGADRFAKMPFARPPLFEQKLIADRLAEIAAMQETESAELRKLTNIKSGLMSDLLTGRVRVPADLLEIPE